MAIPDASLRGWILEVDVGIPAGTFFLIVLALLIQTFSSAVVHVYFISNDVQPAAESAPLMDKLKTSKQFWVRTIYLVLVLVLGTLQVVTSCDEAALNVEVKDVAHRNEILGQCTDNGALSSDITFAAEKLTFNAGLRANTVDYGWKIINEEGCEGATALPDGPLGEKYYNISQALGSMTVFPNTITMEHVSGTAIQEGNCGRWHMLFWYSAALIFFTSYSQLPQEFFLGEGVGLRDYFNFYIRGVKLPTFIFSKEGRSYGGRSLSVGFWTLMPSAFITWIFAKSIHNSALLGGRYGMAGGVAYSAWYISFLAAATVGYILRTKYGYHSLPEAINATYGSVACLLFMLCVNFRLFNEVWSNATVVGAFYGKVGTAGYWGAAWFSVLVPAFYISIGGMRGSLFTDFLQAWGGILILIIVIIALSSDDSFDDTIWAFTPNRVNALNKGGEAGWEPGWFMPVFGGLIQGIISYPFFDSVLTDRAFLSTPKTMFVSLCVGGMVAGTFIIFFSSLGVYGAYHSDRFSLNCDCTADCVNKGLVTAPGVLTTADCLWWTANKMGWGSWGTSSYVGTLLAKNVDKVMQTLMNFIMMTASLSTLDSTFTSIAKLVALEYAGWLHLNGDTRTITVDGKERPMTAPLRPHDVEHISGTHIWVARIAIMILMFCGICFLGFEKDAMAATTVAGTAIMGLGFPIWGMTFWKTGEGGWKKAPLAFILPVIVGWFFGITYYADGKKDSSEGRFTHDSMRFTDYDKTYTCEGITDYANCVSAAVGSKYGTTTTGCAWVPNADTALKGSCNSVGIDTYEFTTKVELHYSRFVCTNLVGHLCCLAATIIGFLIHQYVIPSMTTEVATKPAEEIEAPGTICEGGQESVDAGGEAAPAATEQEAEKAP